MTWVDWISATASAIAIIGGIAGALIYARSKWVRHREQKKLDRMIRAAELLAERDMAAGMFDSETDRRDGRKDST